MQSRRNARAAKRLMRNLLKGHSKLRSEFRTYPIIASPS